MDEQSKAARRRKNDWRFENRWLVGRVLDVGCGPDPMKKEDWAKITEVVPYDVVFGNKDGQYLPEIKDAEFDCVHSSHCLEHLKDARSALTNWLRVIKPGGYIVCTVPEEYLYEYGLWPSRFNGDHKLSFTLRSMPVLPASTNIGHLLWKLPLDVEHLSLLTEGWDHTKAGQDQTLADAESAIEFVARKPHPQRLW